MALQNTEADRQQQLDICAQLKELRVSQGISQRQLGSEIGIAQGNFVRVERGFDGLKLSTIQAWARGLGYKVEVNFVPMSFEDSLGEVFG
jgi:transcriptional regulator with XRE-family HTH domain